MLSYAPQRQILPLMHSRTIVIRAARLFEQRSGRHDLARGAVAALKSVVFDKRSLHRMQRRRCGEAFDGGDLVALMHDRESEAGIYAPAVDVHRARAALAVIAALLRAEEVQVFAQRVEQGDTRLQRDMVLSSSSRSSTIGNASPGPRRPELLLLRARALVPEQNEATGKSP